MYQSDLETCCYSRQVVRPQFLRIISAPTQSTPTAPPKHVLDRVWLPPFPQVAEHFDHLPKSRNSFQSHRIKAQTKWHFNCKSDCKFETNPDQTALQPHCGQTSALLPLCATHWPLSRGSMSFLTASICAWDEMSIGECKFKVAKFIPSGEHRAAL